MKRLAIALALLLTACTADDGEPGQGLAAAPAIEEAADELKGFVQADLEAALADAEAHQDQVAAQCYTAILGRLQELQERQRVKPVGAISGFQKARNLKRRLDAGISDEFDIACGPLIAQVRRDTLSILTRLGSGGLF